jgi:hypothetical protein
MKADLSGSMWSVAPVSATATRELESGEMEEMAKRRMTDWRRSGRMRQEEEEDGIGEDEGRPEVDGTTET